MSRAFVAKSSARSNLVYNVVRKAEAINILNPLVRLNKARSHIVHDIRSYEDASGTCVMHESLIKIALSELYITLWTYQKNFRTIFSWYPIITIPVSSVPRRSTSSQARIILCPP